MNFKLTASISLMLMMSALNASQPPEPGLNFQDSYVQAKQQLKYFFSNEKPPINDSIENMEVYYGNIKEKGMRKMHPKWKLARPCKVIPDPEPGLVNPALVAPTHRYHPLSENERFYGKFAPPLKEQLSSTAGNGYQPASNRQTQQQYGYIKSRRNPYANNNNINNNNNNNNVNPGSAPYNGYRNSIGPAVHYDYTNGPGSSTNRPNPSSNGYNQNYESPPPF